MRGGVAVGVRLVADDREPRRPPFVIGLEASLTRRQQSSVPPTTGATATRSVSLVPVKEARHAHHHLWEQALSQAPAFEPEEPLPTLVSGDIALTSTIARDGAGVRAQVVRRQPDGTWLRLLDQPEIGPPVQQ